MTVIDGVPDPFPGSRPSPSSRGAKQEEQTEQEQHSNDRGDNHHETPPLGRNPVNHEWVSREILQCDRATAARSIRGRWMTDCEDTMSDTERELNHPTMD
jgi:hypothetical protein